VAAAKGTPGAKLPARHVYQFLRLRTEAPPGQRRPFPRPGRPPRPLPGHRADLGGPLHPPPTSYACRIGKGTHRALDQAHAWVKRYRYVFHGDIVKYFPAIDHQIVRRLLAKHIADRPTLWLIDQIINSGVGVQAAETPLTLFPGDDLLALMRPRGLPIGNLTSQFWANVYLHELDMFAKHQLRCPAYLRYMDDFLLFSDDKQELNHWREAIRDFLAARLRLQLHPRKSVVFPVHTGLDFCGFRLFPTHRRLRKSSVRRFVQRFRCQRAAFQAGDLTFAEMNQSVQCWIAHASHGDTWRLRQRIFHDYPLGKPVPVPIEAATPTFAMVEALPGFHMT
jgi:RNA-directed DNA polymerase